MSKNGFTFIVVPLIVVIIVGSVIIGGAVWHLFRSTSINTSPTPITEGFASPSPGPQSKNVLPPEKQAIEDQYAKERAEGLIHAAPKRPFVVATTSISIEIKDVLSWKAHRDEIYGYEIKLPELADADVSVYVPEYSTMNYFSLKSQGYEEITIANRKWYRNPIAGEGPCEPVFITSLNEDDDLKIDFLTHQYNIFGDNYGCTPISLSDNIINQTLSSLIVFEPTNNWRTYHYEKSGIGISFRYPTTSTVKVNTNGSITVMPPSIDGSQPVPKPVSTGGVLINFRPPDTKFGAGEYNDQIFGDLSFDYQQNQWVFNSHNRSSEDGRVITNESNCSVGAYIPSMGGNWHTQAIVYVLKQGFVELDEDIEAPSQHSRFFEEVANSIVFDHPESIIKENCPHPSP